jgi:hypothetical protein
MLSLLTHNVVPDTSSQNNDANRSHEQLQLCEDTAENGEGLCRH